VHQGWKRLDANHPMVKWLVSLSHMEI